MTTPMPAGTPQTTPSSAAFDDAIELLQADHERASALFSDYERLRAGQAPAADRAALANRVCGELTVHARIEEEIFYPALREAGVAPELLDEARREHDEAKRLIGRITSMQPDDAGYDSAVGELALAVRHHVKEEETQIFPPARVAAVDLQRLGERLAERRAQLLPEQGAD